jgi:hypothetical protein
LEKHEIVKSLLGQHLNKKDLATFSRVWEACSEMNVYIQQVLPVNNVFGKGDLGSMGALMMMGLVGGGSGFGGGMGTGMMQPTDTRYLGTVSGNQNPVPPANQNAGQNTGPVRQIFCDKCGKHHLHLSQSVQFDHVKNSI